MSLPSALSLESPLMDLPPPQKQPPQKQSQFHAPLPQNPAHQSLRAQTPADLQPLALNPQQVLGLPSEWIPPPAQLATVNPECIDLNDEIFFNHNSMPSYTTSATDPFTLINDPVAASSSSSSTANFDYSYPSLNQVDLATSPLKHGHDSAQDVQFNHKRRFSLAAEQLSKMTLRTNSTSDSPSPDMYSTLTEPIPSLEEPTVDPKQLFGSMSFSSSTGVPAGSADLGKNGTDSVFLAPHVATHNYTHSNSIPASASASRNPTRYILPSSVSSPSLSTFFSKHDLVSEYSDLTSALELDQMTYTAAMSSADTAMANARRAWSSSKESLVASALNNPSNPYVMNDECVSAITYWLNNTSNVISDKPLVPNVRNSTGVSKPGWVRRNSIQVVSPHSEDSPAKAVRALSHEQKRRRRKSVNNSSISERPLPANLSLNLSQTHAQVPGPQVMESGEKSLATSNSSTQTVTLPSSLKYEETPRKDNFSINNSAPTIDLPPATNGGSSKALTDQIVADDLAATGVYNSGQVSSLNEGIEMGDDEPKPFPCPDCEKQFKRSEHLKRHIRSVHSNIRPFHCKYCEKKFSRSDNLAQHSKTHFKVDANGTTSIIYGNPNPPSRSGRKKSSTDVDFDELPQEEDMT